MRDIEGKYLHPDVLLAIDSFLLEKGCLTLNGEPNIVSIHFNEGFYKTEFTEPFKDVTGYIEIPEFWVKSYIRNKKIDRIL